MGLKLLDILEFIHESGFVYNDLKLENITIGLSDRIPKRTQHPQDNLFQDVNFHLIDFGLASRWLDKGTGKHCKIETSNYF